MFSATLRHSAEPLPDFDAEEFGVPFSRYGDARVVLIGEASHGTSEFYRAQAAITRRLVEQHGFNIIAIEGDWPDAARIDRHVRHQPGTGGEDAVFARFPHWMWRNQETLAFVRWLHQHNATLAAEQRVEFRGLDIYSLRASMDAVLRHLDASDPQRAASARQRYACLTPWQNDPAEYGQRVEWGGPLRIQRVLPSRPDSWEQRFLRAGLPAALTDWRGAGKATLRYALGEPLLQRAIGVIYRPQTERDSHYYQAVLGEQFDAYLWFEQTTPVTPLAVPEGDDPGHEAELFPFGV